MDLCFRGTLPRDSWMNTPHSQPSPPQGGKGLEPKTVFPAKAVIQTLVRSLDAAPSVFAFAGKIADRGVGVPPHPTLSPKGARAYRF